MSEFRTEAACVVGVAHEDRDGVRPLSCEEMCAFVNEAMEHLLDDSRVIDPVVSGRADAAEFDDSEAGVLVGPGLTAASALAAWTPAAAGAAGFTAAVEFAGIPIAVVLGFFTSSPSSPASHARARRALLGSSPHGRVSLW